MLKRLSSFFVSIAATLLVMQSGAHSGTLDEILQRGTVRIAVMQDFAPFGALNAKLEPEGYDIDVAKRIAENLGVKLELVVTTGANRIPYLQTDKADIVVAALGANPERAKSIWFSSAYAPFYSGVFSSSKVDIKSYADLAGKTVGVTRGNLEDLEISRLAPPEANIMRFEDNATTTSAWLTGQVEVLVSGNTAAAVIAANNPGLDIESKIVIKNSPAFLGVTRGNEDLLRWLNVFILHQRLAGGLDELSEKWFGEPLPATLPSL
ncbi:transporter substrate-binding domain-containing protein [Mesorhizobium sp. J428]|uniref:transporter substrate-binding domain-containing protein n=1 Tax=Mesorhizobium sp. J428 TaxID=2898440 RepID=UPI002151ACC9|nr:transporter substrate-binding domain-containing protein [Mesorhizobium sp. J428]MCR5858029.1 transporter substrate-binding domain-containing protein [Mesorhizobium sp. J428]